MSEVMNVGVMNVGQSKVKLLDWLLHNLGFKLVKSKVARLLSVPFLFQL